MLTKKKIARLQPLHLTVLGLLCSATLPGSSALAHAPEGRFLVEEHAIHDVVTGLVWERFAPPETMTWNDAQAHCAGLSLAGVRSRLPAPNELLTIMDVRRENPAVDSAAFGDIGGGDAYWTVAHTALVPEFVWGVYARLGTASIPFDPGDSRTCRVRCVSGR